MYKKIIIGAVVLAIILAVVIILTDDNAMKSEELDYTKNITKIGVYLTGVKDDNGWSASHVNAFESIKEKLNLELLYREIPFGTDCFEDMKAMIEIDEVKIIFLTSFVFSEVVSKINTLYPDVKFFHCSGLDSGENMSTYMGRMYQMRYLAGIVAGMQTESNHIGYVASMPIDEVVRDLNAFALGVRKSNPDAVVHLLFTDVWMDVQLERDAALKLIDEYGTDVLEFHQDTQTVMDVCEEKGIFGIGNNIDKSSSYPKSYLTAPVWNWSPYYEKQIEAVLEDNYKCESIWVGIDSNVVSLAPLTDIVKPGISEAVAAEKERLVNATWDVFYGPIKDNQGNTVVQSGEALQDNQLINEMDWYAECIELVQK